MTTVKESKITSPLLYTSLRSLGGFTLRPLREPLHISPDF